MTDTYKILKGTILIKLSQLLCEITNIDLNIIVTNVINNIVTCSVHVNVSISDTLYTTKVFNRYKTLYKVFKILGIKTKCNAPSKDTNYYITSMTCEFNINDYDNILNLLKLKKGTI